MQLALFPLKAMINPSYILIRAADKGRCAGYDFIVARKRYPLASRPTNPFPIDDPADKQHLEWDRAFTNTEERYRDK